jgi:hypothetical protein
MSFDSGDDVDDLSKAVSLFSLHNSWIEKHTQNDALILLSSNNLLQEREFRRVDCQMPVALTLHDRSEELTSAEKHVTSCLDGKFDDRRPVFVFSGYPGSGKTRVLSEVCNQCTRTDAVVLFATFNSYSAAHPDDKHLLNINVTLPVVARLLHTYLGGECSAGTIDAKRS